MSFVGVRRAVPSNIVLFARPLPADRAGQFAMVEKMTAANDDLREEIGWQELVETVARIRDSLPPEDARGCKSCRQLRRSRRDQSLRAGYGLPLVICPVNSFWERGYGDPPPELLIVLGASRENWKTRFESWNWSVTSPIAKA